MKKAGTENMGVEMTQSRRTKKLIHRVKWRHSNLWLRYDFHVVRHDVSVILCEVNWWRFATLFK